MRVAYALCVAVLLLIVSGYGADRPIRFQPDGKGFSFDTGLLKGKLRQDGKSQGLSDVVHVPTGVQISRSMGLMSLYRIFSANHRYGDAAWNWPSDAELQEDGSVVVRWPAGQDRPFEMTCKYTWVSPGELDVETFVRAATNLVNFEAFLACYFDEAFTNAQVYVKNLPEEKGPGFLTLEERYGMWLVFPRDSQALNVVQDGRWKFAPSPVYWTRMPDFGEPIVVRRSPSNGTAAVLMASRSDCFAVLAPHQLETHYSMYLSLVGKDLMPDRPMRARARLWISQEPSLMQIRGAHERFTRSH